MYKIVGYPDRANDFEAPEWLEILDVWSLGRELVETDIVLNCKLPAGSGTSSYSRSLKLGELRRRPCIVPKGTAFSVALGHLVLYRELVPRVQPLIAEALSSLANDLKKELALEAFSSHITNSQSLLDKVDALVKLRVSELSTHE